ncbi:MAG: CehA/McbA family metallohydrolase, partial [Anaerolineae bacterium]
LSPGACPNLPDVPDLARYTTWGRGSFSLADSGDEVLLLAPDDSVIDAVAFASGDFGAVGLAGDARAPQPLSLSRVATLDSDDMSLDFSREQPSPGTALDLPAPGLPPTGPSWNGLTVYWGDLHAHTASSDGAGPAELALARARAAGLHFYALTDHDYMLRPAEWRRLLAAANDATVPSLFVGLAGFEWTHRSQGHVNIFGTNALITRDQPATSTIEGLLTWLAGQPQALAQFNHPGLGDSFAGAGDSGPNGGLVRLQEVGNGSGSSKTYRLFEDELLQAWSNGWRVAPTIGSDSHDQYWGTDTQARTGIWAASLNAPELLAALRAGRAFATEDANLAIAWRCGDAWMGGESLPEAAAQCLAYYWDGDGELASLSLLSFTGQTLAQWQLTPGAEQPFPWPSGANAAWLRLVQADGDKAWAPPIWLATGQ